MAKYCNKVKGDSAVTFDWIGSSDNLVCRIDEIHADVLNEVILNGIAQKVGDSYAGAQSLSEAQDAAMRVWDNLKQGVWNSGRVGNSGDLAEAISIASGESLDASHELVNAMSKDEKEGARKIPSVAAALASIKARRLAAKVSGESGEKGKEALGALFSKA